MIMKTLYLFICAVFCMCSFSYGQINSTKSTALNYYASFSNETAFLLKSASTTSDALVYNDMAHHNDGVVDGLAAKGYTVTFAANWTDFDTKLASGGYEIAVAFKQNQGGIPFDLAIAQTYIIGGGKMIFATWQSDVSHAAMFNAGFSGSMNHGSVLITDPGLASGITNPITLTDPGWGTHSLGLTALAGGEVLAQFNDGHAAIVRGNSGNTLMLGYLSDTPPQSEDQMIFENCIDAIMGDGARNDNVTVIEDTPKIFNPTQNDNGVDPSTVIITDSTNNGSLALTQTTGQITYTPNPDYFGNDVMEYSIIDTSGATQTANVFITVEPVNDVPISVDDQVIGWEDVTIDIDVFANDINVDGDILKLFAPKTTQAGGHTWVLGDKISYAPPANYSGNDVFEYEVFDNGTPSLHSTAKVYITVTPVNDLPVLDNEIVSLDEDGTVSGDLIDAGDSDPEGTVLQAKVEPSVAPTNGVLEVAVDGSFTYTPNANYNGADLAVVQVCDQGLPVPACVPDSIIITVNGVNDPPVVTPSSITINEDTPAVIDIAGNVTDVEGNGLVSGIISGAATFSSLFELSYVPAPNFNGTEVITYSICDDASACDTGTVTITVTPVNDPPTLISTLEDIDIMVGEKRILLLDDLLALLFNDVDVGDVLTPSVVMANGLPLPAWITIENGTMTLQPYGGNLGCYSFLFVATDLAGATNTEAFDICVINNNIATGIDSWEGTFGVSLYPNPSSGKVVLDVEQVGFNETTVAVYNVTGQTLLNQKFSQKQIQLNLENQVSGMYYVKVTSGNNEVIKKLVLNRW